MLTNDDGIDAPGIIAVEKALKEAGHQVTMVAPANQQSGASSSFTWGRIHLSKRDESHWAIEGKPLDAARIGLSYILLNNPPDLVISGANMGQNIGPDTLLSGTVGAALQAQRAGIPSIALSVEIDYKEARAQPRFVSTLNAMDNAARFLAELINKPGLIKLANKALININYPAKETADIKGIRITTLSDQSIISNQYKKIDDSTLEAQAQLITPKKPEKDTELLASGYITISFLQSHLEVNKKDNKRLTKEFKRLAVD